MSNTPDKAKLAGGAAAIRKAEKERDNQKPFTQKELTPTRDVKEVWRDRVAVLDGHIGLKLKPETTPAENLQVLDYVVQLGDHVQFMIGDVLNDGDFRWSDKYKDAVSRTGRGRGNLWNIASIARKIPAKYRKTALSFSAHRPVATLTESVKIEKSSK